MTPSLTIVVPTIGRDSLRHTLDSIARQALLPDDRVIVALDTFNERPRPDIDRLVTGYGPQFSVLRVNGGYHFYGNPQLNAAIRRCRTDYLCALGDDDIYVDGAIATLRASLRRGQVSLFQFFSPADMSDKVNQRFVLWDDKRLRVANISGCCVCAPRACLVPVSDELKREVDFEWIREMVALSGQPPRWLKACLIIARPDIRHGEPVHAGVSTCPTCGYIGFTEDFAGRSCGECASVGAVA